LIYYKESVLDANESVELNFPEAQGMNASFINTELELGMDNWNGYKYWCAYTPYPDGDDSLEDPFVAVSNDGISWTAPPGLDLPLDDAGGSDVDGTHNSDTNIVYDWTRDVMIAIWRHVIRQEPQPGTPQDKEQIWAVIIEPDGDNFNVRNKWMMLERDHPDPPEDLILSPNLIHARPQEYYGQEVWILYTCTQEGKMEIFYFIEEGPLSDYEPDFSDNSTEFWIGGVDYTGYGIRPWHFEIKPVLEEGEGWPRHLVFIGCGGPTKDSELPNDDMVPIHATSLDLDPTSLENREEKFNVDIGNVLFSNESWDASDLQRVYHCGFTVSSKREPAFRYEFMPSGDDTNGAWKTYFLQGTPYPDVLTYIRNHGDPDIFSWNLPKMWMHYMHHTYIDDDETMGDVRSYKEEGTTDWFEEE